jgi:hypothetical protein
MCDHRGAALNYALTDLLCEHNNNNNNDKNRELVSTEQLLPVPGGSTEDRQEAQVEVPAARVWRSVLAQGTARQILASHVQRARCVYKLTRLRQVTVFRESEDRGYGFMRAPEIFDFIAVAAYARPQLIGETKKVF